MKRRLLMLFSARSLLLSATIAWLAATAEAQQMPQDVWRYDGLQFHGPNSSNPLWSIAIGIGGVYVGEINGGFTRLLQFTEGGVFVRAFDTTFGSIAGIACDPSGNVYVLDPSAYRINVFDQNGGFLRSWGAHGANDGQFDLTSGYNMLAADNKSQVYVCDPGNARVQVFDANGNFLRKWGSLGSLPSQFPPSNPQTIAFSPNGEIYVGSSIGILAVFGSDGSYRRNASILNWANIFFSHAVTPDGLVLAGKWEWFTTNLYVYDAGLNQVAAFNTSNTGGDPQSGLAVSASGNVFAVAGDRIFVYEREYSSVQNPPTPPAIPEPIVLGVAQRENTAWLDVDYLVTDADSATVTTGALAFLNGANSLSAAVPMSTFMENTAGNLGINIPANKKLRFTWNMGADWSIDFAQIQVEVLAKDSRNLMGFHWITVPPDGANPALQICSTPVADSELLSLWYWFIATHDPRVSFANGAVTGVGGAYDGQLLANDAGTTSAGRSFAYGQMSVRAVTHAEIDRANAGNYGFSSVNANSVVKLP